MRFDPKWSELSSMAGTEQEARQEPMLFSVDVDFALRHGGPLTKNFIAELFKLPNVNKNDVVIDSRVHMLKKGWYPCIPGWHIDDFLRGPNGQPEYNNLPNNAYHVLAIVGDASCTEFLDGPVYLKDPLPGEIVYDSFNRQIRRLINQQDVGTYQIQSNRLYRFGMTDFHRGAAATKEGWRWFIRASVGTGRNALNEIRSQVQVYLPWPEQGW